MQYFAVPWTSNFRIFLGEYASGPSPPNVLTVEKLFIYKTRFGAKQISTKVVTQKQLSKVFDRSSMCFYHMNFLYAKSEVLNVNVT